MTGHEGGQGGGVSPGDLRLSGLMLGAKEKVGGDKVENQEVGAEPLHQGCPSVRRKIQCTVNSLWVKLVRWISK